VGAKIIISTNIWKKTGITNGATGTIKAILYHKNKQYDSLPHTIVVHFNTYSGPQFFINEPERFNWIPINIYTSTHHFSNSTRKQMPIKLGYAITVHKSQGQTLDKGVIDFTEIERNLGSSYVQLTRFKNINSFLIAPFSFSRISKQIKNHTSLITRTAEEKRLHDLTNQTIANYKYLLDEIEKE